MDRIDPTEIFQSRNKYLGFEDRSPIPSSEIVEEENESYDSALTSMWKADGTIDFSNANYRSTFAVPPALANQLGTSVLCSSPIVPDTIPVRCICLFSLFFFSVCLCLSLSCLIVPSSQIIYK